MSEKKELKHKILVIDDEDFLRDAISTILSMHNFEVEVAHNGKAGVQKAMEYYPDLIICDISMPEMDGFDVLQMIRNNLDTARIPFVFLSSRDSKKDIRRGMTIGADDYLTKPFEMNELLTAVHTRLQRSKIISQRLEDLRSTISLSLPHEFRTPLTVILGFAQLIRDMEMDYDYNILTSMSNGMYQHALRLKHLIENYILYSNIEIMRNSTQSLKSLFTFPLDRPHQIIESISRETATRFNRENVLVLTLKPGRLQISHFHFKKIVSELVDNAFKFSPPDSPVKIFGEIRDSFYQFTLIDHGIGMTPNQIQNIGAYSQFNRERQEQQGSGLGLIIAKSLVELYDGTFSIESTTDSHTAVTVTLPLFEESGE